MIFQIPAGKLVDKIGKKKSIIIAELVGILMWSFYIIAWFCPENIFFTLLIIGEVLFGLVVALFIPTQFSFKNMAPSGRSGLRRWTSNPVYPQPIEASIPLRAAI